MLAVLIGADVGRRARAQVGFRGEIRRSAALGEFTRQILEALPAHADHQGRVDWSPHLIDSTIVRAHQHAAGTRKARRRLDGEALGRSRGGLSTIATRYEKRAANSLAMINVTAILLWL
jgi:hypothetical protein